MGVAQAPLETKLPVIRYIIIGRSCTGKTILAHHLASANPAIVIYDDPGPHDVAMAGSWIYVSQRLRDVPRHIFREAHAVIEHTSEQPSYAFRVATLHGYSPDIVDGTRLRAPPPTAA